MCIVMLLTFSHSIGCAIHGLYNIDTWHGTYHVDPMYTSIYLLCTRLQPLHSIFLVFNTMNKLHAQSVANY